MTTDNMTSERFDERPCFHSQLHLQLYSPLFPTWDPPYILAFVLQLA